MAKFSLKEWLVELVNDLKDPKMKKNKRSTNKDMKYVLNEIDSLTGDVSSKHQSALANAIEIARTNENIIAFLNSLISKIENGQTSMEAIEEATKNLQQQSQDKPYQQTQQQSKPDISAKDMKPTAESTPLKTPNRLKALAPSKPLKEQMLSDNANTFEVTEKSIKSELPKSEQPTQVPENPVKNTMGTPIAEPVTPTAQVQPTVNEPPKPLTTKERNEAERLKTIIKKCESNITSQVESHLFDLNVKTWSDGTYMEISFQDDTPDKVIKDFQNVLEMPDEKLQANINNAVQKDNVGDVKPIVINSSANKIVKLGPLTYEQLNLINMKMMQLKVEELSKNMAGILRIQDGSSSINMVRVGSGSSMIFDDTRCQLRISFEPGGMQLQSMIDLQNLMDKMNKKMEPGPEGLYFDLKNLQIDDINKLNNWAKEKMNVKNQNAEVVQPPPPQWRRLPLPQPHRLPLPR